MLQLLIFHSRWFQYQIPHHLFLLVRIYHEWRHRPSADIRRLYIHIIVNGIPVVNMHRIISLRVHGRRCLQLLALILRD